MEDLYEDPYDFDDDDEEEEEARRKKKRYEEEDDLAMAAVIMETEVFHPVEDRRSCLVLAVTLFIPAALLLYQIYFA